MPELETPEPKPGALLCWPVLWDTYAYGAAPKVDDLHVTALYWPGYTEADPVPDKYALLTALESISLYRGYRNVGVTGVDAFGVDSDYPVLLVDVDSIYMGLRQQQNTLERHLNKDPFDTFDKRFKYNPHCSVDVKTVLKPPDMLILGPPELWYKDDEPVRV